MYKTNALKLRQSLGSVLNQLKKYGKPILVEKGREPQAVLISLKDYQERFVDVDADQRREEMVRIILESKGKLPKEYESSLDLIREMRS